MSKEEAVATILQSVVQAIQHFPDKLMKFVDTPSTYNFLHILPVSLTVAYAFIALRVLWYLIGIAWKQRQGRHCKGIPSVPGLPFLGLAHRLFTVNNKTDIHNEAMELVHEYGSVIQFDLFGRHFVMVNDGALVKQVLDEVRGKGSFQQSAFEPHQNIFSMDSNPVWRKRRNAFRHPFNPSSLKSFESQLQTLVHKLDEILEQANKEKQVVAIDELFGRFALDVIYNLGFDMQCDFLQDAAKYKELNDGIQMFFQNSWVMGIPGIRYLYPLHFLLPAYRRYATSRRIIRGFQLEIYDYMLKKYMDETLSKNSFAFCLLDYALKENLDMEDVLSELFIIIIAGHETTAHTLSWIVYALTTEEGLQKKCQEAMDRMMFYQQGSSQQASDGNDSKSSSGQTSGKVPSALPTYLEAVVKESMRRYPAVSRGSMRVVTAEEGFDLNTKILQQQKNIRVQGQPWQYPDSVHLQKGTWILVNVYALHNSPVNWGLDSLTFRAERWLENDQSAMLNSQAAYAGVGLDRDHIIFAPFSYGVRNCLGMNMALMEIRAVLPMLLQKYQFQLADEELRDVRKALITDITMKPLRQLPVHVDMRTTA